MILVVRSFFFEVCRPWNICSTISFPLQRMRCPTFCPSRCPSDPWQIHGSWWHIGQTKQTQWESQTMRPKGYYQYLSIVYHILSYYVITDVIIFDFLWFNVCFADSAAAWPESLCAQGYAARVPTSTSGREAQLGREYWGEHGPDPVERLWACNVALTTWFSIIHSDRSNHQVFSVQNP